MSSVPKRSSTTRHVTANDWPPSEDVDGFTWNLGPDPADAAWAASNLNDTWDTDEPTPDDVLELLADEAAALDRLERGLL